MNKISGKFFRYSILFIPVLGVTVVSLFFLASAPVPAAGQDGLIDGLGRTNELTNSQQTGLSEEHLLNVPGSRSEMVLPGWWEETGSELSEVDDLGNMILTSVTDGSQASYGSDGMVAEPNSAPTNPDQQNQAPSVNLSTAPLLLQSPRMTSPAVSSVELVTVPAADDDSGSNRGGGKGDSGNSGSGNSGSGSNSGNSGSGSGGNSGSGSSGSSGGGNSGSGSSGSGGGGNSGSGNSGSGGGGNSGSG